jgi:hypothetical protein
VREVQSHVHTPSCRKYNTECRFEFPKFPSERTLIATKPVKGKFASDKEYLTFINKYQTILKKVKTFLTTVPNDHLEGYTINRMLEILDISSADYYTALSQNSHGTSIILKRNMNEIYVNNYNPEWLKAWDGNLDLQVCLDYYAVLTYITEYYSKNDNGTLKHLNDVAKDCAEKDLKSKMTTLIHAFLSHRQIGESEAYYRILPSLHLTSSNIKCIFLAGGFPENRSRILYKLKESEEKEGETIKVDGKEGNYILKKSMHDKYSQRPNYMQHICLAYFAMHYDTVPPSVQKMNKKIIEQSHEANQKANNPVTSYIILSDPEKTVLRKRSHPYVLRFHSFRADTEKHEMVYSELLFYSAWRDEKELLIPT